MTKLPASWQHELEIQRVLRRELDRAQRAVVALVAARKKILSEGGPRWPYHVGQVNLALRASLTRRNVAASALYLRRVPV